MGLRQEGSRVANQQSNTEHRNGTDFDSTHVFGNGLSSLILWVNHKDPNVLKDLPYPGGMTEVAEAVESFDSNGRLSNPTQVARLRYAQAVVSRVAKTLGLETRPTAKTSVFVTDASDLSGAVHLHAGQNGKV